MLVHFILSSCKGDNKVIVIFFQTSGVLPSAHTNPRPIRMSKLVSIPMESTSTPEELVKFAFVMMDTFMKKDSVFLKSHVVVTMKMKKDTWR